MICMLVRFKSPASHDVLMFGEAADALLALMGMTGRIPSALDPADLPAARERLTSGLAAAPLAAPPRKADDEEEASDTQAVPLSQRALPLLAMIDKAIARQAWVMWEPAN